MAYPQTLSGTRLDEDGKARDRLGRQMPRRIGVDSYLRARDEFALAIIEAFDRVVPGSFWNADVDDDGDQIAVIACPCGEEPSLAINRTVECDCGRYYMNLGTEVRVYRPEEVEAGLPPRDTVEQGG
jgi:hypothetical protein